VPFAFALGERPIGKRILKIELAWTAHRGMRSAAARLFVKERG
jgi:hypothetical protein